MEIRTTSIEDKKTAIELLYSSGSDLYDYLFKIREHSAKDYISYEYSSGKGMCGYLNVSGIYENNELIGTGCFYDKNGYSIINNQTFVNACKYYSLLEIIIVIGRMINVLKLMKKQKNGEIYLSNFAIKENEKGKGIGTKYLQTKMEEYRKAGYSIMGLDVEEDNVLAKKLYLKFGFKIVDEKAVKSKLGKNGRFTGIKMEAKL
jgi:ribosomal protein S18 acetylase RimI-like enzyme